jgi:SAM-dependent methyltransferase
MQYRAKYLSSCLADATLRETFRTGRPLPAGYGYRLDARVVEIPWVLSRLDPGAGTILDAGSSLNAEPVLTADWISDKHLTIVTLAPERYCFWKLGISYHFGDLRRLIFADQTFDTVICISTIEHVGMDNSLYAGQADIAKRGSTDEFKLAVQELKRVLRPGGKCFFSVPFGRYENHGWFQQFNAGLADQLIKAFQPRSMEEAVFRYHPEGWQVSDREACRDCAFFDPHTSKYFDPHSDIDFPPDFPASERAVLCLELMK